MENDGAVRSITKNETHTSTELFVADMLTLHESHFRNEQNAVHDDEDCRSRMASGVLLKALSHHFVERASRNGPFILQLTDFHESNIFVDRERTRSLRRRRKVQDGVLIIKIRPAEPERAKA